MRIIAMMSPDKTKRVAAIDRTLLEPIGEVAVNFQMVEAVVKSGIQRLFFPDNDGGWASATAAIVTSEMSFRKLVDLFHCLVIHRCSDEDVATSKAFCTRLYQLEERRNTITHSNWELDGKTKTSIRVKVTAKSKGLRQTEEKMTKENIQEIADGLAVIAKELDDFIMA